MPNYTPLFVNKTKGRSSKALCIAVLVVLLVVVGIFAVFSSGSIESKGAPVADSVTAGGEQTAVEKFSIPENKEVAQISEIPQIPEIQVPEVNAATQTVDAQESAAATAEATAEATAAATTEGEGDGRMSILPMPAVIDEGKQEIVGSDEDKQTKTPGSKHTIMPQPQTHGHSHSASNDDDDDEPADHESMHGEPGVSDALTGIFGEVNSMTQPDDGKWKTALNNFKFSVQQGSKPPIFVAKPIDQPDEVVQVDQSLQAVLTRSLHDSVADDSVPAQVVTMNCHFPTFGYAHDAILAAVRGASAANCILPEELMSSLSPPIMASARLNLAEDKMRLHSLSATKPLSFDNYAFAEGPIALVHITELSTEQIVGLLTKSPKTLDSKRVRYIIADLPSTEGLSDAALQTFLQDMHTARYHLYVLPFSEQDKTYNQIAHASFLGSEYSADKFDSKFLYVPKTDYELVKKTAEEGGVGGRIRLWWISKDDEGAKNLMKTRHHAH
ncbi:hypothetical protein PhCBS80983_g01982 [Powellomyces hirtus]|uniref:Uncharacterized protein n=1 Tax=Powellomyces hirtus TaxID=109895 RepID=A0A507E9M5_9FUNG|nr:hypothetical protein PhCBS80983_g01982 [Powellomyces hirtus]